MKNSILLAVSLLIYLTGSAQTENPYVFKINGVSDSTIYLANYYGEKLYYADTTRADANGNFSFKGLEEEKEGKYAVVLPGPRYFEIIIADGEEIEMHSDTADLTGGMNVLKSENNTIVYEYMDYLKERRTEREKLLEKLEANEGKPRVTKKIKEEYNALNDKVTAYQKKIVDENPDKFAAKEIAVSIDPEPPVEIRDDKTKAYYYYKKHYFDNIDLKDDRLVRTPVFHGKLDNFLNKTLIQDPDTVTDAMDQLIEKLEPGSDMFKYVVHYATYNFETSQIMGMDKAFVHMVDTYYTNDLAFWMDEERLETIREKADQKRYTLIGFEAPELILQDTAGTWVSTHRDLKEKYVVLFFYDPDCGHCKKETPKLVEFYKDYDKDLLGIYAVSSDNLDKRKKFIEKYEMDSIYNVGIPQKAFDDADFATRLITTGKSNLKSLKYQETFDVFSTPKVIILDENREIRAKDIGVDKIAELIERFEKMDADEKASKGAMDN
ncbi:MAG: redoxin domain-containing protein [Cryomorphaceae bacterium]|nr:DUF5106 domain-containing protein [Flavobacteriales bacterium]